ncbi:MAG: endonuclease/exonuclease/phosphatase family protein [Planctomycetes bacterium]|nr:endonuclease/exonuclease/phosphatase family protein [Planctomycetota bacterium]
MGAKHGSQPLKRAAFVLAVPVLSAFALFAYEGLNPSWRTPEVARGAGDELAAPIRELRVVALNVAKARFYEDGEFTDAQRVRAELDAIGRALIAERADLVFLSEVVLECGPEPLDQVEHLARVGRFPFRAASENYSFGLPFFRIRAGNAVLSRVPLRALETVQLAGGKPFWSPTNNRRALFCELQLGYAPVIVGALRNDSFDLANNLVQTREILDWVGARPALLAGDFNAEPHDESLRLLEASGRFIGLAGGPPTFPSSAPRRRIDHVLAPASWTLVEQHVVAIGTSDHLAVVASFRVP